MVTQKILLWKTLQSSFLISLIVNLTKVMMMNLSVSMVKWRFEKNRDSLFTFLRYDGVPWNNNNAEHAIKAFARLRDVIAGYSSKKGVDEYLTLLSVAETCEYRGIDFLDFLRSQERDVDTFAKHKKRRAHRTVTTLRS